MACCALIAAAFGLMMSIGAKLIGRKNKQQDQAQSWRLVRESDNDR